MSVKTKEFEAFGRAYKTLQFTAVPALALIAKSTIHPTELLANTSVMQDGEWLALNSAAAIDAGVFDVIGKVPAHIALRGVMSIVNEFSFGFMDTWRGVKMPSRFINNGKSVTTQNVDPLVMQLVQDNMATMRDLEEYYSLEDAFKMFDIATTKSVNECLAHEAAKNKR